MAQKINAGQLQRDMMRLNFSTSPTYVQPSATWTTKIMPLNAATSTLSSGSKLTFASNGVKIGAGVSKVKITGMLNFYSEGVTADISIHYCLNGSQFDDFGAGYVKMLASKDYDQCVGMPFYVDVEEDDLINLGVRLGNAANRRYFGMTYLEVEVIA